MDTLVSVHVTLSSAVVVMHRENHTALVAGRAGKLLARETNRNYPVIVCE